MAADQHAEEAAGVAALDDGLVALESAQFGARRDVLEAGGIEALEHRDLFAEKLFEFLWRHDLPRKVAPGARSGAAIATNLLEV
jgi:hypothetical protein